MKNTNELLKELNSVYKEMLRAEEIKKLEIAAVRPANRKSAINLADYMAIRSENVEQLQEQLHHIGLSSLASSESHIKSQILQVMKRLGHEGNETSEIDADSGPAKLKQNISALLGKSEGNDIPPIMVTFDTDFANDLKLLCDLLKNGMRLARINCAHDDKKVWLEMIANLEKAKTQTGLPCKIYMDIAGPKIRTQIVSKKRHKKLNVELGQEITLSEPGKKAVKGVRFLSCTLPGIIENLKSGHRVLIDDGLFEAVVQSVHNKEALLKITRISAAKPEIKIEKGLNFPDTEFNVSSVTDYDKECLPFILAHADMVGFSFVNSPEDMQVLHQEMESMHKPGFPVIAKIETRLAVNNLPEIILQGMRQEQFGVMVARGDLAIEIGFERMSEIQDEILWICEAAHVPVIWATQILETMNKSGIATRGEITDAVHAAAADCVMLNKGGHIVEVLQTLTDILTRSRKNSFKNRRLFRKLSIAHNFLAAQ